MKTPPINPSIIIPNLKPPKKIIIAKTAMTNIQVFSSIILKTLIIAFAKDATVSLQFTHQG